MNRRVALVLLLILIITLIPSRAEELKDYTIDGLIETKKLTYLNLDEEDNTMTKLFELSELINLSEVVNKEIPILSVRQGAVIKTLKDDRFLAADYLDLENGKLSHKGKFIYMEGSLLMQNLEGNQVKDEKIISTREEQSLIKNNDLDYEYWNNLKYEKGGYIEFKEPGYYNVVIKDTSYGKLLDNFIVKVGMEDDSKFKTFTDIEKNQWFYDDVYKSTQLGMIKGREKNKYEPYSVLTLSEAISLSSRILADYENIELIEGGKTWYDNSYAFAKAKGIIGEKEFKYPMKEANREEIAYIFARTLPEEEYETINKSKIFIPDLPGNKYDEYIISLYRAGILMGTEEGRFEPKTYINRAQIAAIVNRLMIEDSRVEFKN